jgi:hypothetical protein
MHAAKKYQVRKEARMEFRIEDAGSHRIHRVQDYSPPKKVLIS